VTTVYVTHDQVEAMTLGQRVAVMRKGRIVQVDAPHRLYAEPRDLFVAGFIGSPAMNLVEAVVEAGTVRFGQFSLPLPAGDRPADGPVVLGIRPESFEDAALAPNQPTMEVFVEVLEDLGSDAHVFFTADTRPVSAEALELADDARGLIAVGGALMTARIHAGSAIRIGERATLAVDPRGLQFFDPATGLRLAPAVAASELALAP
jgi:multiple sugar transport system ATP-binding protein